MLLEMILSHYNEGEECISRFLDSVALQQCIDTNDFQVHIVNDGDKRFLDESIFSKYKFKIKYTKTKPWGGISSVRQYGLENCTADYIMFCDGDDLFLRNNALWDIFNKLKDKPDILTSKFVTDWYDREKGYVTKFLEYNNDNVWIHGKCFSMDFLKKHNINWCTDLQIYEDSFFVRLCFTFNPKKVNIDEGTYFWKFRDGSYTRTEDDWTTITYCEKMDSNEALVRQFLARNMRQSAASYAFVQIFECYFELQMDYWSKDIYQDQKTRVEKHFVRYYKLFGSLLQELDAESARVMMDVLRRRYYQEKRRLSLEDITFKDFTTRLLTKYAGQSDETKTGNNNPTL